MEAMYNGKKVFITYVSKHGRYVLASYDEAGNRLFKVNINELSDLSSRLLAEINKEEV